MRCCWTLHHDFDDIRPVMIAVFMIFEPVRQGATRHPLTVC